MEESIPEYVSLLLKERRQHWGITQKEAAFVLSSRTGISASSLVRNISCFEKGDLYGTISSAGGELNAVVYLSRLAAYIRLLDFPENERYDLVGKITEFDDRFEYPPDPQKLRLRTAVRK